MREVRKLFGERTIPSFLIGLGLGYILWLLTGALTTIIVLPAGAPLGAWILGESICLGIGLHGDMMERKAKPKVEAKAEA